MIFPRDEKLKYEQLQAKLTKLLDSCKKMDIFSYYNPKFCTIVKCASQKLVGSKDELNIITGDSKRGNYQLRRKGLVESFGYSGDRYRIPDDSGFLSEIVHGPYYDSSENKGYFTKFINGLTEIRKKSLHPEGIDTLVQALKDIKAVDIYKGDRWDSSDCNLSIERTIQLGSPIEIQACEESDIYDDGSTLSALQCTKVQVLLDDNDIKLSFQRTKGRDEFHLTECLNLTDFIRISEPDMYNVITKLVDGLQLEVETLVATKTQALDQILEKYGQYLVYKEL